MQRKYGRTKEKEKLPAIALPEVEQMQYHTMPYNIIQYLAIPCNAIQYPAVSCPPKGEPGKEQVPMQPGAGEIKKFCTEYLYCVKTFTAR